MKNDEIKSRVTVKVKVMIIISSLKLKNIKLQRAKNLGGKMLEPNLIENRSQVELIQQNFSEFLVAMKKQKKGWFPKSSVNTKIDVFYAIF